jgi:hypothetical protein
MKQTTVSTPQSEPSSKFIDHEPRLLSEIVLKLFHVSKMHLSRDDFRIVFDKAQEIGAFNLHNLRDVTELMACECDNQGLDDIRLRALLFHIAASVDAASALIDMAEDAELWHYDYEGQREFHAKRGEA